tara:strand:- start:2461 stop:3516 length:1056 start_codon:yes stop_codon:yes gene_type:complete
MELNNIIFTILIFFLSIFLNKYSLFFLKKMNSNILSDDQFKKPQAFHENSTYRLGGFNIFLSLFVVFAYLFFFKNIFFFEYISFCILFFILGFSDDLKIYLKPKFRLLIMFGFLIMLIILNEFYIERISLEYLNKLLKIDIFSLFFLCLCFLFIINGSNLIDGFNGLLGIHSLIIFVILFIINLNYENDLSYILFYTSLIIFSFLIFNFPKAQIFLGDGGAYLVGALIAISVINTNNFYPSISSFFFCILLFYLFFEVFFSFFRKIFFARQSPLLPDNKHLHMLLYKLLLKRNKKKVLANYQVSIFINLTYLLLITPGIIFMDNGIFCRYYFFSLLFVYMFFYKILYKKIQ